MNMPAEITRARLRPRPVVITSIIYARACPTTRPPERLGPISIKPLHVASERFLKHLPKALRLLFERRAPAEGVAFALATPSDELKLPFMHSAVSAFPVLVEPDSALHTFQLVSLPVRHLTCLS
jgi:hypothetical protein